MPSAFQSQICNSSDTSLHVPNHIQKEVHILVIFIQFLLKSSFLPWLLPAWAKVNHPFGVTTMLYHEQWRPVPQQAECQLKYTALGRHLERSGWYSLTAVWFGCVIVTMAILYGKTILWGCDVETIHQAQGEESLDIGLLITSHWRASHTCNLNRICLWLHTVATL